MRDIVPNKFIPNHDSLELITRRNPALTPKLVTLLKKKNTNKYQDGKSLRRRPRRNDSEERRGDNIPARKIATILAPKSTPMVCAIRGSCRRQQNRRRAEV
ncbi:hypothetical protein HW555_002255 [Spodoptera exigua]|uniref:Uncharacterized protein n=1 Tax=Spodoptera exigua TaxID=7107 RepID=A0A835GNI0_SPOEX|nr:hypothetical protein HW555_002255 [Spodoptera exigua]